MERLTYQDRLQIRAWYQGDFSTDIYAFPWLYAMTPIECQVFDQFRIDGCWPMWPQYPVGRFWVDFGNPEFKVAVECDGSAYHNREQDEARDDELRRLGWIVYHLTGSQCMRNEFCQSELAEDIDEWEDMGGINGLCNKLNRLYFNRPCFHSLDAWKNRSDLE